MQRTISVAVGATLALLPATGMLAQTSTRVAPEVSSGIAQLRSDGSGDIGPLLSPYSMAYWFSALLSSDDGGQSTDAPRVFHDVLPTTGPAAPIDPILYEATAAFGGDFQAMPIVRAVEVGGWSVTDEPVDAFETTGMPVAFGIRNPLQVSRNTATDSFNSSNTQVLTTQTPEAGHVADNDVGRDNGNVAPVVSDVVNADVIGEPGPVVITATPEPSTVVLFGTGLLGIALLNAGARLRRRSPRRHVHVDGQL